MIRTTVVGSWPPAQSYAGQMQRYYRGELPAEEVEPLLTKVAAIATEKQHPRALDQHTGGETSADSFILHLPRQLSGIEPTENRQAWDQRGTYRLVGPLGAPQGLGMAHAYQRERAIDPAINK